MPTSDPRPSQSPAVRPSPASAELLSRLEAISRLRPDRVLRLRGVLPAAGVQTTSTAPSQPIDPSGPPQALADGGAAAGPSDPRAAAESAEAFELLIYRGFSSSTTHPTAYDPDQPALPEGASIEAADLLRGPLNPAAQECLAGPLPVEAFLEADGWG